LSGTSARLSQTIRLLGPTTLVQNDVRFCLFIKGSRQNFCLSRTETISEPYNIVSPIRLWNSFYRVYWNVLHERKRGEFWLYTPSENVSFILFHADFMHKDIIIIIVVINANAEKTYVNNMAVRLICLRSRRYRYRTCPRLHNSPYRT